MKSKSSQQAKLERDNRAWRRDLVDDIGHCQFPDCPGEWPHKLSVNEITPGTSARRLAYSRRLACNVLCGHCNCERATDASIWPVERQTALQLILCADIATPQEILDTINFCRGHASSSITWSDMAKYLTVRPILDCPVKYGKN